MHDIRFIRDNPEQFDAALARRGLDPVAGEILEIDIKRRGLQARLQEMQSRRNQASKEIGALKSQGGDADALIAEVNDIKQQMPEMEAEESTLAAQLDGRLMELPNLLDDAVPAGDDEDDNELVRTHGSIPRFSFTPRDHVEIGEGLGQMDFALGAKVSGARFVVLRYQLARLERALAAFMLDLHTSKFGYVETMPPYLVNTQTMTGTGQLPKFAEDLYRADDKWLIPTAEVPLTNIVAGEIVDADSLPLRMTAHTP